MEFGDGESYEVWKGRYRIREWYGDSMGGEDLLCCVGIGLGDVGMGEMMGVEEKEMEGLGGKSN